MAGGTATDNREGRMDEHAATDAANAPARAFAAHRQFLIAIAYRILGQLTDAEDVVQEAWLRWSGVRTAEVADSRAYLVTITTRLALDRLRRLRARRETYVGDWLPEPLLTAPDAAEDVERAESIALALLVVLETLSPLERAVFVLREAFGFPHAEIAAILGRDEAAVRQLARRARVHVDERRPRFDTDRAAHRRLTERFLAACVSGEVSALLAVLAPDVALIADGGGKALAPRRPIRGADRVARFLTTSATPARTARFLASLGVATPSALSDLRVALAPVNGDVGIVASIGATTVTVIALDVADGAIRTIYLLANPDKLVGLRPSPAPE